MSRFSSSQRVISGLLVFLSLSAVYLYAFPQTNLIYPIVVLLHAMAGVVATGMLLIFLSRRLRQESFIARTGWVLVVAGGILGLVLLKTGTPRSEWNWLYSHILISSVGIAILLAEWAGKRGWLGSGISGAIARVAICFALLAAIGYGARYLRESRWQNRARIENPAMPPATMNDEGDGPQGPFFPSSAQVYGRDKIPSKFFMESDSCKRCHKDVYNQWFSSVHHFSSFNNQWYRKSIEYMQDTVGTKPSKWCAGCHDHAVFFNGRFDRPIKDQIDTPEAQAGLSCTSCHAITHVRSTMGQGDFEIEYPPLHDLAASDNRVLRFMHDQLTYMDPKPHREIFLKPFHREQTPEFCSSCHKVHLDVPVNSYRWFRGFNDYDNWQASGISGEGARSFYYPKASQKCADCHMPKVKSNDPAAKDGFVRSHRFAAANTALPFVNGDKAQLEAVQNFLRDGQVSVDVFGLVRAPEPSGSAKATQVAKPGSEPALASTFAVGEESMNFGAASNYLAPPAEVIAPLDKVGASVRRGDSVRIEVVVRTRKVGHFFPGGTVDAFDVWVELEAVDENGRTIFHSGSVEDGG